MCETAALFDVVLACPIDILKADDDGDDDDTC